MRIRRAGLLFAHEECIFDMHLGKRPVRWLRQRNASIRQASVYFFLETILSGNDDDGAGQRYRLSVDSLDIRTGQQTDAIVDWEGEK